MQRATSIIVGQGDIACPVLHAHFCCLQAAHKGRFPISSSTWCRSLKTVHRGGSALPHLCMKNGFNIQSHAGQQAN